MATLDKRTRLNIARFVRILPTTTATLHLPTGLTGEKVFTHRLISLPLVKVNGNVTAAQKTGTTFFLVLSSSYFSFFLFLLLISSSYLNFYISSFCSFFTSRSLLFALSYHKNVFFKAGENIKHR
jgi:hypothetical protein